MNWNFTLVAGPLKSQIDSPIWDEQRILFTQADASKIWQYDPSTGNTSEYRRYTSRTTRLAISPQKVLYGAQSGSRRIVKFNPDGSTNQLEDKIQGRYHNHPFDVDVDRLGRVWFSDPYSSIPSPGPQIFPPLDYCAILRQVPSPQEGRGWVIQKMTEDTTNPGAILLSKDQKILFVMERNLNPEDGGEFRAYPLKEDGTLGTPKVIEAFPYNAERHHVAVAGMCLDNQGYILACGTSNSAKPEPAVVIYSPEGRTLSCHPIPNGDYPTNCGFGGPALDSLFITTENGKLYQIDNTNRQGCLRHP